MGLFYSVTTYNNYKELTIESGQCIDHYLGDTGVSGFLCLGIAPTSLPLQCGPTSHPSCSDGLPRLPARRRRRPPPV